jgi:hypothetical protein
MDGEKSSPEGRTETMDDCSKSLVAEGKKRNESPFGDDVFCTGTIFLLEGFFIYNPISGGGRICFAFVSEEQIPFL